VNRYIFIAACVLSFLATVPKLFAKDLGIFGPVYPIAERDAHEEIEEKARSVDWNKIIAREMNENRIRNYKPKESVSLPRAAADFVKMIDLTYTLDFDIPDGRGGVLYAKGFSFNPLDYILYPRTIIILNGSDRGQVEWLKASSFLRKLNSTLWITEGSYYDLSRELGRSVYFVSAQLVERFSITAVPSIISQQQNMLEVREVCIDCNEK